MLAIRLPGSDFQEIDQMHEHLRQRALILAAAWSDFHVVQETAAEVVRRFGTFDPRDLGVVRLHKHPLFVAFQTACVNGYVRPFVTNGGIGQLAEKYRTYARADWEELHQELFIWSDRLAGEDDVAFRQFIVAPNDVYHGDKPVDRYIIGEATPTLDPLKDFTLLQQMCADRKALLWPDLESVLAECYPFMLHLALLSIGSKANQF